MDKLVNFLGLVIIGLTIGTIALVPVILSGGVHFVLPIKEEIVRTEVSVLVEAEECGKLGGVFRIEQASPLVYDLILSRYRPEPLIYKEKVKKNIPAYTLTCTKVNAPEILFSKEVI